MTLREFRIGVLLAVPIECREDFFFTLTATAYYADYKPGYPVQTAGDFTISYDIISGKCELYSTINLGVTIPTIRHFNTFADLRAELRNMEV